LATQRLNQPLIAFQVRSIRLFGQNVFNRACKQQSSACAGIEEAEETNEIILRVVELDGREQPNVRIRPGCDTSARKVNGQWRLGQREYKLGNWSRVCRYQPRTLP
jgi:hypothetical protein